MNPSQELVMGTQRPSLWTAPAHQKPIGISKPKLAGAMDGHGKYKRHQSFPMVLNVCALVWLPLRWCLCVLVLAVPCLSLLLADPRRERDNESKEPPIISWLQKRQRTHDKVRSCVFPQRQAYRIYLPRRECLPCCNDGNQRDNIMCICMEASIK
jgi:hypothetical protein